MECGYCSNSITEGNEIKLKGIFLCPVCVADAHRGFLKSETIIRLSSGPYKELFNGLNEMFSRFRGVKSEDTEQMIKKIYEIHTRLLLLFLSKNDTVLHHHLFRLAGWFEQSLYAFIAEEGHMFGEDFWRLYESLMHNANILFKRLKSPESIMRMDIEDLEAKLQDMESQILGYEGSDKVRLEHLSIILFRIMEILIDLTASFRFPNPGYFEE